MAKSEVTLGVTDRTVVVFIPDPASTDGSGKTGLVAANLTVSYTRVETDNDVVVTDVTGSLSDLSALTDAHADWGLKEVSNTLAPGLYRLDIADAVFASGAWYAVVYVMITTSAAAASPMEFSLVAYNPLDGVRLGLTALPNAAADAAGGLIISDAGGLDADAQLVTKINDILTDTGTTLQAEVDGIQADTEDIQTRLPAALTADGNIKADTLRVGGTLQTAGDIIGDTNDIQTRLPAALVSGRIDASVGAIAANAITAASMAADASAEIADAVWDEDATGHQSGGTFGQAIGDPGADTTTIYQSVVTDAAGTNVAADIIAIKAQTAAIETDTAEIGAAGAGLTNINLPNQTMDITGNITGNLSGSVGSVTGAVGSVAGNVDGSVGSLAAQAKADVNAEVVDALATDTYAEPGQATPGATTTLAVKLGYLYKAWRNKSTQTATEYNLYNDDTTTVGQKATVSDDATTATKGEVATGP